MQPGIPKSENQFSQSSDSLTISDSSIFFDNEQESRFSLSDQHSMLSQKTLRRQSSRRSSLVKPPVCSVCQGDFFRVRDKSRVLYPSSCYAVPEKSAFFNQTTVDRSVPIQFVGVNIANFDENDQTTRISDQGETTCEEFSASRRRSSIVVMENPETLRNDEILSQLDMSDEDSDDDNECFPGRRSIGSKSLDEYKNVPVSRLRIFIKQKQELDEVNQRYREMINRIDEERNRRANEDMEVENDYIQDPFQQPVIPGQMDNLVEYNNQCNKRLSGCFDSNMMNSEYKANNISSPRLSKVDSNRRENAAKKRQQELSSERNYRVVMIQRLRRRMSKLPYLYDVQSVLECSKSILESSGFTLDLANDVRTSWEKNRDIDEYQEELNAKEKEKNRLWIDYKVLETGSIDCLMRIGDDLGEFIKYYASLLGYIANYSDKSDLFLHFPFHEGYFFIKIHFSNSTIVRVTKNHDTIKDEDLNMMLYRLKTIQSIHNEYRYWEIPEMIQNVSNDLTRIKQAWEELHGE